MEPDRLAHLSRRYARYGRSLPGLSLALGGVVILGFFLVPPLLINNLSGDSVDGWSLLALCTALLVGGWLLAKEWLRGRIYLSLGLAEAPGSRSELRFNLVLTILIALLACAFAAKGLLDPAGPLHPPSRVQMGLGLSACLALPACTRRYIRGVMEGLLWIALCYWALGFIWMAFPGFDMRQEGWRGWAIILTVPIAYFGGLTVGLIQHFNFLRLAREIKNQETPND